MDLSNLPNHLYGHAPPGGDRGDGGVVHSAECVMPNSHEQASATFGSAQRYQLAQKSGQMTPVGGREGSTRDQMGSSPSQPKWHRQRQLEIGVQRRDE